MNLLIDLLKKFKSLNLNINFAIKHIFFIFVDFFKCLIDCLDGNGSTIPILQHFFSVSFLRMEYFIFMLGF